MGSSIQTSPDHDISVPWMRPDPLLHWDFRKRGSHVRCEPRSSRYLQKDCNAEIVEPANLLMAIAAAICTLWLFLGVGEKSGRARRHLKTKSAPKKAMPIIGLNRLISFFSNVRITKSRKLPSAFFSRRAHCLPLLTPEGCGLEVISGQARGRTPL